MARSSRSRSPIRRERPGYGRDGRHNTEESSDRRAHKYRDEEDVRYERYRRSRYENDKDGYRGRSGPGERDRSRDGRRRRDERDRDGRDGRDRRLENDKRERERERERGGDEGQAGPSASQRHSNGPSSARSRSRSKSPSVEEDKGKPNFNQSGLLAAATNAVQLADGTATVLKYNEPPEARKPPVGWRLYVFKGKEQTDLLHIQRQSCYLIGRDKSIVDIYVEHPSCSKQHAVIQYRQVHEKDDLGSSKTVVKPFIIDLESTNNTYVNDEAIPQSRYYELKLGDVLKFGMSTREYVLLHDDV